MARLILSRKGFDSSSGYGYGYSPFDPKTGKYIVLPIPEEKEDEGVYQYSDLLLKDEYIAGIEARDLEELIHHPYMNFSKKTKQVVKSKKAHFDPILGECPWIRNGPTFGAFGQSDAAAGHLRNNEVGEGSVFLFFSRFLPIKDSVHPLHPMIAWTEGVYYIYGWLKVKKVFTKENMEELPPEIKKKHPHGAYFNKRDNNTIYLAADKLFDDLSIPGCGYFPKLTKKLLLSSELHKNKPSIWKLPAFFNTDEFRPTYLNVEKNITKRWLQNPDNENECFVQTTGRGQEYVTELKGESEKWLRSLFVNSL